MATRLTPEEREVLSQMLSQGQSRHAIAKALTLVGYRAIQT